MKNLLQLLKSGFLALVPFLLASKVTVAAGGVISVTFPPLASILTSLPDQAATLATWYELVVRLVPTARNYSLLSFLYQLFQSAVPNRASNDVPPYKLAATRPSRIIAHF